MATSTVLNFLVGGTNKGKYPAVCGSELSVNMYKCTNGKTVYMESMPGLKMLAQVGGKCRGVWVSTRGLKAEGSSEDMFVAMGNRLYRVTPDGTCTPILTLAANGRRVTFAEAGGPRAILLVCDGSALYAYFLEEGTVHQVATPQSVEGDGHTVRPTFVTVVNGVIVINDEDSGYAYYSVPYPLSADTREVFDLDPDGGVQYEDGVKVKMKTVDAWEYAFLDDYGVQQFLNSESNSDSINGLASIGNALYVFGPKSVEIYTYAGEEYATWSRQYFSATGEFGLEAPNSLCCVGRSVYFVSTGRQFGKCVQRVTGTNFERVSEDWLDDIIGGNTVSAYGFGYGVNEHSFYVLQVPEVRQCWTFDAATGEWHERRSRNPRTALETRWRVGGVAYFRSRFYAFTEDGMVATFGNDYWWEDYADGTRSVVCRHRQGPVFTSDFRPFIMEDLTLECNVGCFGDYAGRPRVLLEISRDGGMTYGNVRSSSFGLTGQYSHRVRFLNMGRNRLCVVRVTFSEPMDFVLTNCSVRAGATGSQI